MLIDMFDDLATKTEHGKTEAIESAEYEISEISPDSLPTDARGLSFQPCTVCGGCHFWQPQAGGDWHCSDCSPSDDPLRTTCSLPGGKPATSATTRSDLEALHPATVAGGL